MSGTWIFAFFVLCAVVILLALLVLGTLRRIATVLVGAEAALSEAAHRHHSDGLPVGAKVPAFTTADRDGIDVTEEDLIGARTLVLFLGATCPACKELVEDLTAGMIPDIGARLVVVGDHLGESEIPTAGKEITFIANPQMIAAAFGTVRIPEAFLVDDEGRLLERRIPSDWESIQRMVSGDGEGGETALQTAAAEAR